ncbi:MAG TPA: hypothetical protein VNU70_03570 [Puia sp.]|jgi:hypothetical protein|nr:hypothetical protein [Puia sp.]
MNDFKMVNTKINKIGGYIAAAILIGLVIFLFYKGYQIRHHFAFTTGRVVEITKPGWRNSGDYSVLFEYVVKGKMYGNNNNYNYCSGQSRAGMKSLLVGKQFPVVYAVKEPSGGFMLLTQQYAEKYKYQLPDSVLYYDSVLTCK